MSALAIKPPVTGGWAGGAHIEACMSSIHSTSATDPGAHDAAAALHDRPGDLSTEPSPPPPRTAVLLGLAFGASAGLMTVLYLILA